MIDKTNSYLVSYITSKYELVNDISFYETKDKFVDKDLLANVEKALNVIIKLGPSGVSYYDITIDSENRKFTIWVYSAVSAIYHTTYTYNYFINSFEIPHGMFDNYIFKNFFKRRFLNKFNKGML